MYLVCPRRVFFSQEKTQQAPLYNRLKHLLVVSVALAAICLIVVGALAYSKIGFQSISSRSAIALMAFGTGLMVGGFFFYLFAFEKTCLRKEVGKLQLYQKLNSNEFFVKSLGRARTFYYREGNGNLHWYLSLGNQSETAMRNELRSYTEVFEQDLASRNSTE